MSGSLPYEVSHSRWRWALRRLLGPAALACAVVVAWPAGAEGFNRIESVLAASRHRSECFQQCAAYRQSGVAFDEAQTNPVLVVDDRQQQAKPRWHRSRADDIGFEARPAATRWWPPYNRRQAVPLIDGWQYWDDVACSLTGRIRCVSCLPQLTVVHKPLFHVSGGNGDRATLFLHGRQARKGDRRVVAVTLNVDTFIAGDPRPIEIQVVAPAMPLRSGRRHSEKMELPFACTPTESLRLYAGQPDALDASHFTIPYDVGTRTGKIDGWLQPDDTVTLTTSEGKQ